jgi:response regulator RpfG family c-di-GMP phosphodiesterase
MRQLKKLSIKKIGYALIALTSVLGIILIRTNHYTEKSFRSISEANIYNYTLSNNIKEMDLPIKVIGNISIQEINEEEKERRLKEVLLSNINSIMVISEEGIDLIEFLSSSIEESSLYLPTEIQPEELEGQLDHIKDHLDFLLQDVKEIQQRGLLNNSDYIAPLKENYEALLSHYDTYYLAYLKYESDIRLVYTTTLNMALSAMILTVMCLVLLVFRLINVDMKVVIQTYNQIETHDFDSKKVMHKTLFSEEERVQAIMRKLLDDKRIIEEFQKRVSKQYVIDDIIDYLLTTTHESMSVDRVGIAFYDEKNNALITEYGVAVYDQIYLDVGYRSDLSNSSLSKIIEYKQGYINNDLLKSYQKNPESSSMALIIKEGIRSNMSMPLIMNNEVFGVVFLSSKTPNHFTKEHYMFAENLLYEITGVLNRSYLMKVFIIRMTNTIARLVDKKDNETGEHISRMVKYSTLIANNLYTMRKSSHVVDSKMILAIERNAALHDIGKVATPDNILKKPGRLTPDEFEIMKEHAAVGGDVFRDLNKELEDFEMTYYHTAEIIARYHHEKWDGSGYPLGLKGDEIPMEARIVAVADVFDALSSKRVYKESMAYDKSIELIREQAGKHFDPVVVEAFLYDLDSVREIYDNSDLMA